MSRACYQTWFWLTSATKTKQQQNAAGITQSLGWHYATDQVIAQKMRKHLRLQTPTFQTCNTDNFSQQPW